MTQCVLDRAVFCVLRDFLHVRALQQVHLALRLHMGGVPSRVSSSVAQIILTDAESHSASMGI